MRQLGVGSHGGAGALAIVHQLICEECAAESLTEPIARIKVEMRQLGVGSQGGAGALAIVHQLIYEECAAESLTEPIARIKVEMRQLGVGSQGGAGALAIVHQLIYEECAAESLTEPIARIKVDEKNCFGMIEWKAVRDGASRFLPKHTAAMVWKHGNLSYVEQEGLSPMPKDRGAENKETWTALWSTAGLWESRQLKHVGACLPSRCQAAFHGLELTTLRLQADHAVRLQETANFQLGRPEKSP